MPKVAIMITSCDAYQECWKPMIHSLDKYWPDCEYPRYIITNFKEENLPNTFFIKVGDDNHSWCTLAKRGLAAIDSEYVIFFQEDYWLGKVVDNEAIKSHIKYFEDKNLDYLKIQDDVRRDNDRIGHTDYCYNKPNIRYSINTATAIWKKDTIVKLLNYGWSGWEYERQVINYIKKNNIELRSEILFSDCFIEKGITIIPNAAIVRGVWTPSAVNFLKENGFETVLCKRKVMGKMTTWLYSHSPGSQSLLRLPFWAILKVLKYFKVNW